MEDGKTWDGFRRIFVLLAVAYGTGICLGVRFQRWDAVNLWQCGAYTAIFVMVVIAALAVSARFGSHPPDVVHESRLIIFLLLALIAGLFRVYCFETWHQRHLKSLAGKEAVLYGVVAQEPTPSSTGKTLGFTMEVQRARVSRGWVECPGKVKVYVDREAGRSIVYGDSVFCPVKLQFPDDAAYQGGFSYRSYLLQQDIVFSVYTRNIQTLDEPLPNHAIGRWISAAGRRLRTSILNSVDHSFVLDDVQAPENLWENPAGFWGTGEEGALLKGILIGDREEFSEDQYANFTNSGLVHVAAVSGMHVAYLCMGLTLLLGLFRLRKRSMNLFCIPVLILFAAASEFTPSVCRASLMMGMALLSYYVQREPDTLTAMALAAVVLLTVNPYAVTSYSFLLSFGATLGILVFAQPLAQWVAAPVRYLPNRLGFLRRPLRLVLDSFAVSLAGSIGLGYFMMRFFGRLQWGSLIGNIVAVPLVGVIFLYGYINWLISLIAPDWLMPMAAWPLGLLLKALNTVAAWFAKTPFQIRVPAPPPSFFVVYVLLCALLRLGLEKRKKKNEEGEQCVSTQTNEL